MLRSTLRRLRAEARRLTGVSARTRARLDGSRAVVLFYHRVLPAERAAALAVEPGMYVTPETFELHLDLLQAHFRPLSLGEIATALEANRPLPPGACAITFDDGWRDNYQYALPALRRRGFPATVFVVTERVGTRGAFWPDAVARALAGAGRERLAELADRVPELFIDGASDPLATGLAKLKTLEEGRRGELLTRIEAWAHEGGTSVEAPERELLDWDELCEMRDGGFEVEAHGTSHTILTTVSPERAEREIRDSGAELRERGFGAARLFAYPNGSHDAAVRERVREAGYRAAVTIETGLVRAGLDLLRWPRVGLHEGVSRSPAEFLERVPGTAP
jgi:peptidoglycan/xylan/chitin deacetylase (PgdA/CDA1 family)